MKNEVINIASKMDQVKELWTPKIIEQMNDYHIKVAKFEGEFTWHSHEDTDEVFIVVEGKMSIMFRDSQVDLQTGDLFVVDRGVEHKPFASQVCKVLLIEPKGTVNTGDIRNAQTESNSSWI